jgi:hypothetical protein
LKYSPAAGRISQLPPSSRSRSSVGNDNSQARYSGLTRSSAGLSNTVAGMKLMLIGCGRSMPGGNFLAADKVFHQVFGPIGPHDVFGNADEIARHTGPLGDRMPALRVDPQERKLASQEPASGLQVARM